MKTKVSTVCFRETNGLNVCQKSSIISKKSCSHVKVSQQMAEFCVCIQDCHRVSLSAEVSTQEIQIHESIDYQQLLEGSFQFQKQPSVSVDSLTVGRMESTHTCSSNLETIFSPALEPVEVLSESCIEKNAGADDLYEDPRLGTDDSDKKNPCDYQTCNVSDFYISDILIASIPFKGNAVDGDITKTSSLREEQCAEPGLMLDVAEHYMVLPYLEDTITVSNTKDEKSCDEAMSCVSDASPYLTIDPMRFCKADIDQAESFDPHLYMKNFPELSDMVSNFRPIVVSKDAPKRKVTLVLDLDETLVHSTLAHCDDADFTFTVFFNMQELTVYVKQRPHLQTFLERVSEMFQVAIFTASQSIYAEQLLDKIDPEKKIISFRAYRESCIFSDGSYTKDLSVLGIDLAKIAIIDNSPQVFRLQVNNGIPITSWFDDPSDTALISLLPFLATLADADDVRPIIARRFGNRE